MGTLFVIALLTPLVVGTAIAIAAGAWEVAAVRLVTFDVFALMIGAGQLGRWRAKEAEMANRQFLAETRAQDA